MRFKVGFGAIDNGALKWGQVSISVVPALVVCVLEIALQVNSNIYGLMGCCCVVAFWNSKN